eukprot:2514572-Prymnesium_polylepis.2
MSSPAKSALTSAQKLASQECSDRRQLASRIAVQPLLGTGLVYQHTCKEKDVKLLPNWFDTKRNVVSAAPLRCPHALGGVKERRVQCGEGCTPTR